MQAAHAQVEGALGRAQRRHADAVGAHTAAAQEHEGTVTQLRTEAAAVRATKLPHTQLTPPLRGRERWPGCGPLHVSTSATQELRAR
jgi:hypothetical protein